MQLSKSQNPLHQFPRSKSVTSWQLPYNTSTTSSQHKRQIRNKLVQAKVHCVCCVVSFPKFHYNNLLPTSGQLPRIQWSYGETCVMDFGHKQTIKTNRMNEMNTIKQTSQNKTSSIIVSFRQLYRNMKRPQYSADPELYTVSQKKCHPFIFVTDNLVRYHPILPILGRAYTGEFETNTMCTAHWAHRTLLCMFVLYLVKTGNHYGVWVY